MNNDTSSKNRQKHRPKFSIATKLLAFFLLLSVTSFAIVGFIAILNMNRIGLFTQDSSTTLGKTAASDSMSALEEMGEDSIKQKAIDVARQVEIYLEGHADLSAEEISKDSNLAQIALQPVGQTGYTALYEKETGIMRFHPNPDLVDYDMHNLSQKLPSFWMVFKPSLRGSIFSGYYDWEDADGSIRTKFMYMVPVENTIYMIAATTYIDEFSQPALVTKNQIDAATAQANEHIEGQIRNTQNIFIGIFAAMILVVSFAAYRLSKRITQPILALNEGAKIVGGGNLDYQLEIKTGDEIEDLANAFSRMTNDLKIYIKDLQETTAAKERIESELRIATEIQTSMLPRIFPPFPDREEFEIYATMDSAKEVAGDFYDFFFIGENELCLVIGDVCGKGIPAALFMAISKTLLKNETLRGFPPAEVLSRVNNILYPDNDTCMFFTGFLLILNVETGRAQFVNGGHNPPLIYTGGSDFEFIQTPNSLVVGVMPDTKFESKELIFKPGDVLFMYTDGVTDAVNPDGQLFSAERLQQRLSNFKDEDVASITHLIAADIETFVQGMPQFDDITMLALRFKGKRV